MDVCVVFVVQGLVWIISEMDQREITGQEKKIPPGAWMSVSCECSMLSSRGPCDVLITRPEESYLVWCV
jgi:hypothetical protein